MITLTAVTPTQRTLGENIKTLRERAGLTQKQLAEQAGLGTPSVVGDIENNRRPNPWLPRIVAIAKVLKKSIDVLLEGVDAEYEPFRRDLSGHAGSDTTPPPAKDGANVISPDKARILELEEQVAALTRDLGNARDFIERFGREADALGENRPPPAQPPRRRGGRRGAR